MIYKITNTSKQPARIFGRELASDESVLVELTPTELEHVNRHDDLAVEVEVRRIKEAKQPEKEGKTK